jgi:hypothetical protein
MLRTTTLAGTILLAAALALSGCAGNAGGGGDDSASASAKGSGSESAVGEWGDIDDQTQPSLVLRTARSRAPTAATASTAGGRRTATR